MKFISIVTFLALASSACALSVASRSAQDVFVPAITSPIAGDVWPVGSTQNVTWYAAYSYSQCKG